MPIRSVAPFRLYRQVAEQIAGLIKAGEFDIGERLPSERELAGKLGVSRPTVREAMIALEIAGLVEVRTGAGIFILSHEQNDGSKRLALSDPGTGPLELIDARIVLETAIAAEAAQKCDEADLRDIAQSVEAMGQAQTTQEHRDADRHFHAEVLGGHDKVALEPMLLTGGGGDRPHALHNIKHGLHGQP